MLTAQASILKKCGIIFANFLIAAITPIRWYLLSVGILVLVDLLTGVRAAQKREEKIQSRKMSRSLNKIVFYFIAILLTEMMQRVFFTPILPENISVTAMTAGFVAMVEFKSNMENISDITGLDIWKKISESIPSLNGKYKRGKTDEKNDGGSPPSP